MYLKTYLSNAPNTVDQIQIQIHGFKFDEIQIQIRRICICKHKYVFHPSPDHYCFIYLRDDQNIWITTKVHIFTKGFKRIECGCFLRDHSGFHEHNKPKGGFHKL